uniref:Uncharacterized protein n=1 Tax=Melopsittacus undulatus TaxID=13146 RepID=A0A8V5GHZ0_MELUD
MAAVVSPLPPAAPAPPGGGAGPPEGSEALLVALGAGLAAASHPLLYVKLLVQVGHEPLPPTIGRNVLGRKVLYLPGFFTYARHIVEVDGKRGLFRGLTPRLISSTLSTITRGSVKKAFPLEDMEHVSNKDDVKTSLRKVVKETSHEMMMQCMSRVVSHPLHVISMRCMVQFIGREVKYSGVFSAIGRILKEEGILGFFVGLVPHILGDVIFLWCCNLLAHFINTYAVDDNFSQASVIRSYTKFVIGVARRPPSLCSCIHVLDPLLEASQCSGEGHMQALGLPMLLPEVPEPCPLGAVTCFHPPAVGLVPSRAVLLCLLRALSWQPAAF